MIYEPPKRWTEKELLGLSGEDDRYEFKSGRILNDEKTQQPKSENILCNELAVEICAFANSFGGTLFLGIKNNKKVDGISKFYKGKNSNPFKEWLDKKIAHFLEFRLPNYRVTEVEDLSNETSDLLGEDKVIIAVDIFDSDLAPHQCKFDNKYYYRQSSNSNPAPHHYLAYLWSRTNSNMSSVVNSWFQLYLNGFIELLEKTANYFERRNFNAIDFPFGNPTIHIRRIIFFELENWKIFNSTLTAKQFLRTYPDFNSKRMEFTELVESFFYHFSELEKLVETSPEFEQTVRQLVINFMQRERIPDIEQYKNKPFEEILRHFGANFFEGQVRGISEYPKELKDVLIRMTAYNLLNLDLDTASQYTIFFTFCKEQIANKFSESLEIINSKTNEINILMNKVSEMARNLYLEAEELRYALALKHNTTYE